MIILSKRWSKNVILGQEYVNDEKVYIHILWNYKPDFRFMRIVYTRVTDNTIYSFNGNIVRKEFS